MYYGDMPCLVTYHRCPVYPSGEFVFFIKHLVAMIALSLLAVELANRVRRPDLHVLRLRCVFPIPLLVGRLNALPSQYWVNRLVISVNFANCSAVMIISTRAGNQIPSTRQLSRHLTLSMFQRLWKTLRSWTICRRWQPRSRASRTLRARQTLCSWLKIKMRRTLTDRALVIIFGHWLSFFLVFYLFKSREKERRILQIKGFI